MQRDNCRWCKSCVPNYNAILISMAAQTLHHLADEIYKRCFPYCSLLKYLTTQKKCKGQRFGRRMLFLTSFWSNLCFPRCRRVWLLFQLKSYLYVGYKIFIMVVGFSLEDSVHKVTIRTHVTLVRTCHWIYKGLWSSCKISLRRNFYIWKNGTRTAQVIHDQWSESREGQ